VLVAAVLGPEQREDGELEVVGVSTEKGADTVELPVREAEGEVERLFRNAAQGTTQGFSLARRVGPHSTDRRSGEPEA
jgi:hypothetical protein